MFLLVINKKSKVFSLFIYDKAQTKVKNIFETKTEKKLYKNWEKINANLRFLNKRNSI